MFNLPQWASFKKKALDEWLAYCAEIEQATEQTATEDAISKKLRIDNLLDDYEAFCEYYFPNVTRGTKSADFHIQAANAVCNNVDFKGVFEWGRGHAKTTHMSLFIPLFLKAKSSYKTFLLVGQNEVSAKRLLDKIQAHLTHNKRYILDFGTQINSGDWAEGEFSTLDGTKYVSVGRGQSPRGISSNESFRPDYIVIDDLDDDELVRNPRRVKETVEWIEGSLFGTMDMGRGRFVMVGNRIGKNSVLANIIKKPGIFHTQVNALNTQGQPSWSEKYTLEEILAVKAFVGYFAFEKEYQNNPIEAGTVFKNEWLHYDKIPKLADFESIVAYLDPSFKSSTKADYKAISVVGRYKTKLYLIDCFVRQCSIVAMVSWLYDLEAHMQKNTAICSFYMEASFMQDMILDDFYEEGLKRGWQLPIIGDRRAKPDKFARVEGITPIFERGWFIINQHKKDTPDFKTAIDQMLAFEKGSKQNDDFPDATEGAIWQLQHSSRTQNGDIRLGVQELSEDFW